MKTIDCPSIGLRFIFSMIIVVVVTACATVPTEIRPETGFRDLAWGTPMAEVPDLKPLKKGGGSWKWAVREPESLKIGDVKVDSITYIFVNQLFLGVNFGYAGEDTFKRLINELTHRFGRPSVVNKKMNMLSWNQDDTTLLLRYYRRQNMGELKYMHDDLIAD